MAGKVIDLTLRLVDKVTKPIGEIGSKLSESCGQWVKSGKQIEKAGKSIEGAGKGMTTSLTLPIAGAGLAAGKMAADFEAGMSKVKSISGAAGSDVDILAEKAMEMGKKTKFSATEATQAYEYMAMAGWKAGDMADGIEGIMYLAGATGEDLATTSDIVTDALTAFGKKAGDTEEFVDVLAKTAASANTDVGMLGESFKYVAPVAGTLGYGIQDTATALGLMANSGIKASQAGTSLRTALTNMASPTNKQAAAMKELGISLADGDGKSKDFMTVMKELRKSIGGVDVELADAEGNARSYDEIIGDLAKSSEGLSKIQQVEAASTIFGKNAMSGMLAIVNASDSDFQKLTEEIYNSSGACKEMYDVANDNLNGQLTTLKSATEGLAISFGQLLLPYVKEGAKKLQALAERFNGMSDAQKETILKVLGIVAAIGPALLIFGKMVGTVGRVVGIVGKFGKALKSAGSLVGLVTSPVGIVILVLGALVVATILVIKNWDKIKAAAQKVFGAVKDKLAPVGKAFDKLKEKTAPIGEKFKEIGSHAKELWAAVKPVIQKIGEKFAEAGVAIRKVWEEYVQPVLKYIGDAFHAVFNVALGGAVGAAKGCLSELFNLLMEYVGGFMDFLDGVIMFLTGVFTGNWEKAWEGVKKIFSGIFDSLAALVKVPVNAVIGLINGAIEGVNKLGLKIPDWVPVIGGKDFKINIPTIPTLAAGTDSWKGGLVQISEKGGEIVDLPGGSRVYPHERSVQQAYSDGRRSGGSVVVNIPKLAEKIIVREDADIDRIVRLLADRLEKTALNMGGGEIGYNY